MSRVDRLNAAYEHVEEGDALIWDLHAAIPDLLAVVRAAQKHTEDCCRTDIGWREQMQSHDVLATALDAFEAGGKP